MSEKQKDIPISSIIIAVLGVVGAYIAYKSNVLDLFKKAIDKIPIPVGGVVNNYGNTTEPIKTSIPTTLSKTMQPGPLTQPPSQFPTSKPEITLKPSAEPITAPSYGTYEPLKQPVIPNQIDNHERRIKAILYTLFAICSFLALLGITGKLITLNDNNISTFGDVPNMTSFEYARLFFARMFYLRPKYYVSQVLEFFGHNFKRASKFLKKCTEIIKKKLSPEEGVNELAKQLEEYKQFNENNEYKPPETITRAPQPPKEEIFIISSDKTTTSFNTDNQNLIELYQDIEEHNIDLDAKKQEEELNLNAINNQIEEFNEERLEYENIIEQNRNTMDYNITEESVRLEIRNIIVKLKTLIFKKYNSKEILLKINLIINHIRGAKLKLKNFKEMTNEQNIIHIIDVSYNILNNIDIILTDLHKEIYEMHNEVIKENKQRKLFDMNELYNNFLNNYDKYKIEIEDLINSVVAIRKFFSTDEKYKSKYDMKKNLENYYNKFI